MEEEEEKTPEQNAIADIILVMEDMKMYINEKKYTVEAIKILHDLGYYDEHVTIYEDLKYAKHK